MKQYYTICDEPEPDGGLRWTIHGIDSTITGIHYGKRETLEAMLKNFLSRIGVKNAGKEGSNKWAFPHSANNPKPEQPA